MALGGKTSAAYGFLRHRRGTLNRRQAPEDRLFIVVRGSPFKEEIDQRSHEEALIPGGRLAAELGRRGFSQLPKPWAPGNPQVVENSS